MCCEVWWVLHCMDSSVLCCAVLRCTVLLGGGVTRRHIHSQQEPCCVALSCAAMSCVSLGCAVLCQTSCCRQSCHHVVAQVSCGCYLDSVNLTHPTGQAVCFRLAAMALHGIVCALL